MRAKLTRSIFAFVLSATFLCQPPVALACGPFTMSAVFSFTIHPEYPLENFAGGELGVVQPSYARSYLYVAYRYFAGSSFTTTEQQALAELWNDRLNLRWDPSDGGEMQQWLNARKKVMAGAEPKIDAYRAREKPNEWESFLNCPMDAFASATKTLEARTKLLGAESPALKQWVEAQDQVFANCSEGQHIPAALPADADAQLRADRDYQIAAANFYAGNFDLARTQFGKIAASQSPWRSIAAYLIARTLLRKASLGPDETKNATLAEAEVQFNKILTIAELQPYDSSAKRLLNLVRLRLHPEERLHELGLSLVSKAEQASLKQDLWDYTTLLDNVLGEDAHHQKAASPVDLHGDDLTDWITTFQSKKQEAFDHSLSRWQSTASVPWLIAALAKVEPQHPKAVMLQEAAAGIVPSSPAFATASFLNARLDIAAGRFDAARTKLDDLLQKHRSRFNRSSLSLLQQQRTIVSNNLDEFLTYAQRVPAGFSWDEDGRELPADEGEGEGLKSVQGKAMFDVDVTETLNERMPLALLSQVANSNRLADHLHRDVTQAVWLRAVLLDNTATANALVPQLKSAVPELAPLLNEYVNARGPEAKKFAALYAWLKFPGLEPVVDAGIGRQGPLSEQDSYRDNWWCAAAYSAPQPNPAAEQKPIANKSVPSFVTAAQQAVAEKEYAILDGIGASPNYLCRLVLDWATKNPRDPRVPEALHLAVKTTRYGCTDKQTGKWSKAAHDFLHQRYPNSTWTKQTPYWFKE